MVRSLDKELLSQRVLEALEAGPRSNRELREQLNVSQSTISRILKSLGIKVMHLGARRSARYALPRKLTGVQMPLPVYQIGKRTAGTHCRLPPGRVIVRDPWQLLKDVNTGLV